MFESGREVVGLFWKVIDGKLHVKIALKDTVFTNHNPEECLAETLAYVKQNFPEEIQFDAKNILTPDYNKAMINVAADIEKMVVIATLIFEPKEKEKKNG